MFDGLIDLGGGVIPVLMIVVVLVLVVAYMGSRYKVAAASAGRRAPSGSR